jgi:uncharacterized protein YceK
MKKAAPVLVIMTFLLCLMMSGCADIKALEAAAVKFHQQYNDREFAKIYAEAGEALKKEYTEAEMIEKLEKVYREMGPEISTRESSWKSANGWIFLDYDTEFKNGRKSERLIYSIENGVPALATYKVN